MRADDLLEKVNAIRPNPYGSFLGDYLKSLDNRIRTELLGETDPVYNEELLALDETDSGIYEFYLFSVIDFLNGEYGRYANSSDAFNNAYSRLLRKAAENSKSPERSFKIWME